MKLISLIQKPILISLICAYGLTGCSNETTEHIPVGLSTGFIMPTLLESELPLNSIHDLPELITAPWYTPVNVSQTKVGDVVFASCADYFAQAQPSTRAVKDSEMNAYLELAIMCKATKLLISANASNESYISRIKFDAELPTLLPKEVALQIASEESKRNSQNPELKTWHDITPITQFESQSETKATYSHDGGYQEVEMLGHGDTNNDGIEDVLILVRDYAQGGSYFNLRLFVFSVSAQGSYVLIKSL